MKSGWSSVILSPGTLSSRAHSVILSPHSVILSERSESKDLPQSEEKILRLRSFHSLRSE